MKCTFSLIKRLNRLTKLIVYMKIGFDLHLEHLKRHFLHLVNMI